MNLGVDPRHADQDAFVASSNQPMPNGTVPHGSWLPCSLRPRPRPMRPIWPLAPDIVGAEDLVETVQKGRNQLRPPPSHPHAPPPRPLPNRLLLPHNALPTPAHECPHGRSPGQWCSARAA